MPSIPGLQAFKSQKVLKQQHCKPAETGGLKLLDNMTSVLPSSSQQMSKNISSVVSNQKIQSFCLSLHLSIHPSIHPPALQSASHQDRSHRHGGFKCSSPLQYLCKTHDFKIPWRLRVLIALQAFWC